MSSRVFFPDLEMSPVALDPFQLDPSLHSPRPLWRQSPYRSSGRPPLASGVFPHRIANVLTKILPQYYSFPLESFFLATSGAGSKPRDPFAFFTANRRCSLRFCPHGPHSVVSAFLCRPHGVRSFVRP